uniref:Transcription factor domain-containing protein n=1 Tax=Gibberella zeae TaxID=5518 RepID=A0A4E9EPU3_GIBZA
MPTRLWKAQPVASAFRNQLQRPQEQDSHRPLPALPSATLKKDVVSPFTSKERLTVSANPRFARPNNGQVNGYVKFNWPTKQDSSQPPNPTPSQSDDDIEDITPHISQSRSNTHNSGMVYLDMSAPTTSRKQSRRASSVTIELVSGGGTPSQAMMVNPSPSPPEVFARAPRMVPKKFGHEAAMADMDYFDRRLFDFYIKNWCPGRSVLENTNLWLKDLAPMGRNKGILHAIQSLAGVYIYDYLPDERIRKRINERYTMANEYFAELLNAPQSRTRGQGREVITMAMLLSMQDVILTERRLKKPYKPRWLEGFKQGEYFLQQTDPGRRFWKESCDTVQYDPLRISQSIIVGRALILAQPMMELPDPTTIDPEIESNRFNWLLYGTENDLFEIHGGCGFSRRILHIMSQVTYCAARLKQEPESIIVPITAKFLMRTLTNMRQWSREGKSWEQCRKYAQTISWVRIISDDFMVSSKEEITEVTAEAWRIAATIYCQCRLLRLPRNHPDVVANMDNLTKCIRIMPTSGLFFTAQAPLLPVFFLGLLATRPAHKNVSNGWFQRVTSTPVRSSVPPLYDALKRIWKWIDKDKKLQLKDPVVEGRDQPVHPGQRDAWWEHLVKRVVEEEAETTLYLT